MKILRNNRVKIRKNSKAFNNNPYINSTFAH